MPLEQFKMKPVLLGMTNMGVYMTMATMMMMMMMGLPNKYMKGESISMMKETWMSTMKNMLEMDEKWVGAVYTMWMMMMTCNMMGMMPYSYTCTSSMEATLSMSVSMLMGITMMGMKKKKLEMLALMVPSGTPLGLVPGLVMMESMSYMTSGMSLGVSLGANMMAGHLLLKMMSGFMNKMGKMYLVMMPVLGLSVLMTLEMSMGVLQSMVFMLLVCTYMKDVMC